jgi:hypothetical protein
MNINKRGKQFMKKTALLTILLVSIFSLSGLLPVSHAANVSISNASVQMSSGLPGASSVTHTITFTPSDTTDTITRILLQYATTATGSTVPTGLVIGGTPTVIVKTNGTTVANTATYSSGLVTVTFTTPQTLSSGGATTLAIAGVTNPTTSGTYYYVQVTVQKAGPTTTDYGVAENEVLSSVSISGTMDSTLSFTVTGLPTTSATNTITHALNNATITTTSSSIPFGSFNNNDSGTNNVGVQAITTATNATNGYSVYLQENQTMTNGNTPIPDVSTNTNWTNGTTVGFGVNVQNGSNGDTSTTFTQKTNDVYQPIPVNTNSLTLATTTGVTSGSGDSEYVIYQVGVNADQVAGSYSNTLDYVVVPDY